MENKYITTSIPYVNGQPHLGHALEFIEADVLARFWKSRLNEESVFLQTGSDENSLKNVRAAEEVGEEINSFISRHAEEFKNLSEAVNGDFDSFIRTRDEKHIKGAQKLWSMCKPEDIYKKRYSGHYCVGCEAFYNEDEIEDGKCPTHLKEVEKVEEENYFFALSNYQKELESLIENDEIRILPKNRKNEMLSFIRQGLQDFSISRSESRAKGWGVEVPSDESQIMYVWFDALSNYITGLDFIDNGENFVKFWESDKVERIHIVGKDILRFHAIYWPAMLLSAGLKVPNTIFVHGFFTVESKKMSKSLGNVIHPNDFIEKVGVDALRYYLLREMPYSDDGDISEGRLKVRYQELANQWGNLASRVSAMAVSYFDGDLDDIVIDFSKEDERLLELMKDFKLKEYIDYIFSRIAEMNEKIENEAPFKVVKENPDKAKKTLSELRNSILWVAEMLKPIMPESSARIIDTYSGKIEKLSPLFPRLED